MLPTFLNLLKKWVSGILSRVKSLVLSTHTVLFNPENLLLLRGRIWSIFRRAAPSMKFSPDYWRCVKGAEPIHYLSNR